MTIRCRLDELLLERGLTATQVAADTGIAESTLSEMRTNKVKRYGTAVLDKLCAYLGCELGELLVREAPQEGQGAPPDAPRDA